MYALPRRNASGHACLPTGLSCPDCDGVLGIVWEGQEHHPSFRCRVGHRFALTELLAAKEGRLENRLWAALVAVEEVVAVLHDIESDPHLMNCMGNGGRWRERIARGQRLAGRLRVLIENDQPIDLSAAPVSPPGAIPGRPGQ